MEIHLILFVHFLSQPFFILSSLSNRAFVPFRPASIPRQVSFAGNLTINREFEGKQILRSFLRDDGVAIRDAKYPVNLSWNMESELPFGAYRQIVIRHSFIPT